MLEGAFKIMEIFTLGDAKDNFMQNEIEPM